jgi:acyl carrier protein
VAEAEQIKTAETTVVETLYGLLRARGADDIEVTQESKLTADLGMDSLELAELSAVLEDELGHDPYSEGIVPETVAELVAFYSP